MAVVKDIQELIQRQTDLDTEADELVVTTLAVHEEHMIPDGVPLVPPDLSPRPLKLIGSQDDGSCECCGEPKFTIRDGQTGRTGPVCRMCINAVRRQSLHHRQYTSEICCDCLITTDSLGIITGAIHRTRPFEDATLLDGTIRPGIGPLLRAGCIDLTDGCVTITDIVDE